jgi:hypothetical protein
VLEAAAPDGDALVAGRRSLPAALTGPDRVTAAGLLVLARELQLTPGSAGALNRLRIRILGDELAHAGLARDDPMFGPLVALLERNGLSALAALAALGPREWARR